MIDVTRSRTCARVRGAFQDAVLVPAVRAYCAPFRVTRAPALDTLRGPLVIVANHASHLDTPALLAALPPSLRHRTAIAAASDYFYRSRLLGAACSLGVGTFAFERQGRDGTLRAAELLADGWNVLLFPQGTRGSNDQLPFRLGVGHLLAETGVPVLPVGITGARNLWPRGQKLPRRGPLEVRIGDPWRPDASLSPRAIVEELQRRVTVLAREAGLTDIHTQPDTQGIFSISLMRKP
jgi:1-acyl-sn-glycerol-3-phosphate acyltransferase